MDIISTSSGRLLLLVDEILEISRLHAGTVQLDRRPSTSRRSWTTPFEELYPRATDAE